MSGKGRRKHQHSTRRILASPILELLIRTLGIELLHAVIEASRVSELERLLPLVVEYNAFVSEYGETTGRSPESLAVDLNEAALLKLDELRSGMHTEWRVFAGQFANQFGLSIEALSNSK